VKTNESKKTLNEKLDSVIEKTNARNKLLKKILSQINKDTKAVEQQDDNLGNLTKAIGKSK
jgi:small-conductance mechanosensitive channel